MADLWVPFVAAFIAAAAALVLRQILVAWSHRTSRHAPRRAAAEPNVTFSRAMLSERLARSAPARHQPGRDEPSAVAPARDGHADAAAGDAAGESLDRNGSSHGDPAPRRPIIIGAPAAPIIIGAPSTAAPRSVEPDAAAPAPAAAPARTATARHETPTLTDDDEMARRLRVAVGPGRPSTTVAAKAAVWSQWTQEMGDSGIAGAATEHEPAGEYEATPSPLPSDIRRDAGGDDECPHCAGARQRGAKFCGRCGRLVSDPVAASG